MSLTWGPEAQAVKTPESPPSQRRKRAPAITLSDIVLDCPITLSDVVLDLPQMLAGVVLDLALPEIPLYGSSEHSVSSTKDPAAPLDATAHNGPRDSLR